ncbi:MAG: VTT domain-containing protein [Ramlibacter sp.]|nr:VTT domain-containing protein [Ramlibacter sp.]
MGAGAAMLMSWGELMQTLDALLLGDSPAWVLCLALALTTLLLEDVAIAAGVALAVKGALSWELSFVAVAGGIAAGDAGLYALGLGARRVPWLHRRYIARPHRRSQWVQRQLRDSLPTAVLLARVIPGLRLLTYTACGFVRVPLAPFCAWVVVAVALWTAGLYWFSARVGHLLAEAWGLPPGVAVALPILLLAASVPLARALHQHFQNPTP